MHAMHKSGGGSWSHGIYPASRSRTSYLLFEPHLTSRCGAWQAKQAGKVAWESSVTSSEAVGELAELLVALEDVAHQVTHHI